MCNRRKNIPILRHKIFTYRQHEGQNFHDFVTELKKLSSVCEFETHHDSLINDKEYLWHKSTHDNSLRDCLSRESELTLPKAIYAGHSAEVYRKHALEILTSNETIDLHKISKHLKSRGQTSAQANDIIKKCKFCHHHRNCPANGKVCHNCNRKNHFKKCYPRHRKTLH